MRLSGKVAIVTGAAKGLGRAFCLGLAREGARIMAVTRKDLDNLEQTVRMIRSLGGEAEMIQADVAQEGDTRAMAQETLKKFGRLDILLNNAAIYDGIKRKPFFEIDLAEWDLVMNVNVKGAFLATRAVFPFMKEQGYGKIINLASEVFFTGSNGFAHYVASKGGIIGLTRALAVELGPHNICINCIAPGFYRYRSQPGTGRCLQIRCFQDAPETNGKTGRPGGGGRFPGFPGKRFYHRADTV